VALSVTIVAGILGGRRDRHVLARPRRSRPVMVISYFQEVFRVHVTFGVPDMTLPPHR